jgi:hypothetical protein
METTLRRDAWDAAEIEVSRQVHPEATGAVYDRSKENWNRKMPGGYIEQLISAFIYLHLQE